MHRNYAMQKLIIEGVEVQRSSGNVYADLGLPDAEKLKIKTGLVVKIRKAAEPVWHLTLATAWSRTP